MPTSKNKLEFPRRKVITSSFELCESRRCETASFPEEFEEFATTQTYGTLEFSLHVIKFSKTWHTVLKCCFKNPNTRSNAEKQLGSGWWAGYGNVGKSSSSLRGHHDS